MSEHCGGSLSDALAVSNESLAQNNSTAFQFLDHLTANSIFVNKLVANDAFIKNLFAENIKATGSIRVGERYDENGNVVTDEEGQPLDVSGAYIGGDGTLKANKAELNNISIIGGTIDTESLFFNKKQYTTFLGWNSETDSREEIFLKFDSISALCKTVFIKFEDINVDIFDVVTKTYTTYLVNSISLYKYISTSSNGDTYIEISIEFFYNSERTCDNYHASVSLNVNRGLYSFSIGLNDKQLKKWKFPYHSLGGTKLKNLPFGYNNYEEGTIYRDAEGYLRIK